MNRYPLLTPRRMRHLAGCILLPVTAASLGAAPTPEDPVPDWQDRLVLSYRQPKKARRGTEELHHKILIENPNQQESMRRLADLYEEKNEYFLAQVVNGYLLKRNLRDRKLLMQRERLARKLAEQPRKEVTEITVDVVEEFTNRALARKERTAITTMEVDLRARMAAGERSPAWLFALARLSEARHRTKFSSVLLEYCLEQSPGQTRYLETQADLLGRLGEDHKAAKLLDEYFAGADADPDLLPLACRATLNSGQYAASKKYAERWTRYQPDNYEAWLGLGKALTKLENVDPARKALLKSVMLEKDNKEAYYHLALISLLGKDEESAQNWFAKYGQHASAEEVAEALQWPPFADWEPR